MRNLTPNMITSTNDVTRGNLMYTWNGLSKKVYWSARSQKQTAKTTWKETGDINETKSQSKTSQGQTHSIAKETSETERL